MLKSIEASKQLRQNFLLRCKVLFPESVQATHVWYADKPPNLGGIPRKITIEELDTIMGHNFIYVENIYFDRQAKANLSNIHSQEQMRLTILNFLKNPMNDKLVICYMNEQVGYGVFARVDISIGDIVAIYAGELKKTSARKSKQETAYGLDVDTFAGKSDYYIDAAGCGGIARFFQHLPLNSDELASHLLEIFRRDPPQIEKYVARTAFTGDFTELERKNIIAQFKHDVTYGTGEMIKGMLIYAGEGQPSKDWQFKRAKLNKITPSQIASANLEVDNIIVDNKPIVFLWAARDIKTGEQLGFDYGLGYWSNLHKLPLLFDKNGSLISKENYRYMEMPLMINTSQGGRCFFYDETKYMKDLVKGAPVCFSIYAQLVSFFWLRKKLAKNNIVSSVNLPKVVLNTFLGNLKEILSVDFKTELYERYPESNNIGERYIYDVVCQTRSLNAWGQACKILKGSNINSYCIFHEATKEIIIKGVNIHAAEMQQFVQARLAKLDTICKV